MVGVGVMVKVGVMVGVWVAVADAVAVGNGDAVRASVAWGAATAAPPQAVKKAETNKVKRISCFIIT